MADLPEYQPNSQVTPGPLINAAPIHQAYSQMADDVEKTTLPIAQELRSQQVSQEATVAGTNPAFKTIPAIGAAAKEYNEIGLEANRHSVSTDIMKNLNQFHQEALEGGVDANSVNNYTQKATAYLNGLMKTVPVENRELAKNWWTAKSTEFQVSLQGQFNNTLRRNNTFDLYSHLNTYAGEVQQAAMQGNITQALSALGSSKSQIKLGIETGLIHSPFVAAKMVEKADQDFHLADYKGRIKKIMNDPMIPLSPEVAIMQRRKNVDDLVKGFSENPTIQKSFSTPASLHTAQSNLNSFYKQEFGQQKINSAEMDLQINANHNQAYLNGKVDDDHNAAVMSNMPTSKLGIYLETNEANAALYPIRNALINGTRHEKEAAYSAYMNLLNDKSVSTTPEGELYNKVAHSHAADLKGLYNAANGEKSEYGNLANITMMGKLYSQSMKKIDESNLQGMDKANAKSHAMFSIQSSMGYKDGNYQLLPQEAVSSISHDLNNAEFYLDPSEAQKLHAEGKPLPLDMPTILGSIQKTYGNDPRAMSSIIHQLEKSGNVSTQHINWLKFASNKALAGKMGQISQCASLPEKTVVDRARSREVEPTGESVSMNSAMLNIGINQNSKSTIDSLLSSIPAGSQGVEQSNTVQSLIHQAAKYALYLHGYKSESLGTAYDDAADLYFGSNYNTININRSSSLLPATDNAGKEIDPDMATHIFKNTILRYAHNSDIPHYYETHMSEEKRKKDWSLHVVNGVTVQKSGSNGVVYVLPKGDKLQSHGKTVFTPYEDITNPNSLEHKFLNDDKYHEPGFLKGIAKTFSSVRQPSTDVDKKDHPMLGALFEASSQPDPITQYSELISNKLDENKKKRSK